MSQTSRRRLEILVLRKNHLWLKCDDAKETFSTNGANAFLYFGLNVNDNAPNDFP